MERTSPRRIALARLHRSNPTRAEAELWPHLRKKRLLGFKFRRQVPVGPFFADFLCHEARLAIELDGAAHTGRPARDRTRDAYFNRRGIAVLRFPNWMVLERIGEVLALITACLPPRALPPPRSGGGPGGRE
ncbi:MAG: DUF559 domain-containing protein [Myxococcales bacterium]|nr:DUF559 domain-containing protein [Myxococcales bacterium]